MNRPFGRHRRIAIYCDDARPEFSLRILNGFSAHFAEAKRDWKCSLHSLSSYSRTQVSIPFDALDGVIAINLSPASLHPRTPRGFPIVYLGTRFPAESEALGIYPDDTAISQLAADRLLGSGVSHFAFMGDSLCASSEMRGQAFEKRIAEAGFPVRWRSSPLELCALPGNHPDSVENWIRSLPSGTGVFACDDRHAELAIRKAASLNIAIPETLKILGVNNEQARCNLCSPALSSINLDYRTWGKQAIEQLSDLLAGKRPTKQAAPIGPVEVIERRSTEVAAAPDGIVAEAIKLIQSHATCGLTVDALVDELKTTRSNLERSFRKHRGRSPQTELRETKLSSVKSLLSATNLTITEIAMRTGFENPEYLYVAFKRSCRMTPTQYRNRTIEPPCRRSISTP